MHDSKPLFILAFDHRASLPSTLGLAPATDETAREALLSDTKELVFRALERVAAEEDRGIPSLLVDEQFGADVAVQAKAAGIQLAMPAEQSGRELFEFAYPDWQQHIERFDPDLVKVLVRWNPEGDREGNQAQGERLAQLSAWLKDNKRPFMIELLVPATTAELAAFDDDSGRYDTDLRPALAARAMQELRAAGSEPAIWKLEGVDTTKNAEMLVATAREGGRNGVDCIVLGRGADTAQVDQWLGIAAPVEGFTGFAIGRSIWAAPLTDWVSDRSTVERATEQVAANYSQFCDAYAAAMAA